MKITALDESGAPAGWWFIYKVPKLNAGVSGSGSARGCEYAYFDQTMDAAGKPICKSDHDLDSGLGALNKTLHSIFTNPDPTTGFVLYNDEVPTSVGSTDNGNLGHTKGVPAFDVASGTVYWLLHSWPLFADPNATTEPTPIYGQTYLCISMGLAAAQQIAAQMIRFQEPQTFFCRKPKALATTTALAQLIQPPASTQVAGTNVIDLKSAAGMDVTVIAKNREWNGDFWNDLVGPALKQDIDVETWIRGPVPSVADSDGIHKTFDIKYINLGPLGIHFAWPETQDHAKWASTKLGGWVCVGDINRMISQCKRGGGTIAFKNNTLWIALTKSALLLAPPGHTRNDADAMLQGTHAVDGPTVRSPCTIHRSAAL